MKKGQILLRLLQFLITVSLVSLEFVETDTGEKVGFAGRLFSFIFKNRLLVAICLGILLEMLILSKDFLYLPSKRAKEIRQTIMETMLEELFENDKMNVRITIFKDVNLWRKILIYLQRLFVIEGSWKKFDNYVFVWERLGKEYPDSRTFLRYNSQSQEGCQGIAGFVRQSEIDILVENLPNIEQIKVEELSKKDKNTKRYKTVTDYMKRSYIDDFDTLKRLHRKSRHIYGNVLTNQQGELKGVLVIDSLNDQTPFNNSVLDNIPYYLKLIATTL